MAPCEQADQHPLDYIILANDYLGDFAAHGIEPFRRGAQFSIGSHVLHCRAPLGLNLRPIIQSLLQAVVREVTGSNSAAQNRLAMQARNMCRQNEPAQGDHDLAPGTEESPGRTAATFDYGYELRV